MKKKEKREAFANFPTRKKRDLPEKKTVSNKLPLPDPQGKENH